MSVWLEGSEERKVLRPECFLPKCTKNVFSEGRGEAHGNKLSKMPLDVALHFSLLAFPPLILSFSVTKLMDVLASFFFFFFWSSDSIQNHSFPSSFLKKIKKKKSCLFSHKFLLVFVLFYFILFY